MTVKTSPKPTRVLGIDASTNSLAFSLFDNGELVRWGEVEFKGKTSFERLYDAQNKSRALAKELEADLIAFESAVFVRNKKTVVTLAYAFGAIVSALMSSGARVSEIPPITWQYAIGNKPLTKTEKAEIKKSTPDKSDSWYTNAYRLERKQRTIRWVKSEYGIDIASDNIADAIAIGHVFAVGDKDG